MKSILKIAEALQMISSTKLKNYRNLLQQGKDYRSGIRFLFEKFYLSYEHDFHITNSKFILNYEWEKTKLSLWVVIGSDLSLCGRFNRQVLDYLNDNFNLKKGFLVVFGRKLLNLLSNTPFKDVIISSYSSEIHSSQMVSKIEEITADLLREYVNRQCFYLKIIYKGVSGQSLKKANLLPFTQEYFGKQTRTIKYEPHECRVDSSASVIELFPIYVERTLLLSLLESKVSEHNHRREVMTNAVKSAEEKLDEYNLIYQKMRQSAITQEISEITAAIKCK